MCKRRSCYKRKIIDSSTHDRKNGQQNLASSTHNHSRKLAGTRSSDIDARFAPGVDTLPSTVLRYSTELSRDEQNPCKFFAKHSF